MRRKYANPRHKPDKYETQPASNTGCAHHTKSILLFHVWNVKYNCTKIQGFSFQFQSHQQIVVYRIRHDRNRRGDHRSPVWVYHTNSHWVAKKSRYFTARAIHDRPYIHKPDCSLNYNLNQIYKKQFRNGDNCSIDNHPQP